MPQYGADGYALKPRHTHPYILSRCSPGTRMRTTANHPIRMLDAVQSGADPARPGPVRWSPPAATRSPNPAKSLRSFRRRARAAALESGACGTARVLRSSYRPESGFEAAEEPPTLLLVGHLGGLVNARPAPTHERHLRRAHGVVVPRWVGFAAEVRGDEDHVVALGVVEERRRSHLVGLPPAQGEEKDGPKQESFPFVTFIRKGSTRLATLMANQRPGGDSTMRVRSSPSGISSSGLTGGSRAIDGP